METGFGGNNLCKINLAAVKTAPRKIGHGRNGQKRKSGSSCDQDSLL